MKFEESKSPIRDDESYHRTISIARPSIKKDVLTSDDFEKGMMFKQSPSFLKNW